MTLSLVGKMRPCAVSSSGPRVLVVASRSRFPSVLIAARRRWSRRWRWPAYVRMLAREGAGGAGPGGGSWGWLAGGRKSCGGGIERAEEASGERLGVGETFF
jgi:hypothetical protein